MIKNFLVTENDYNSAKHDVVSVRDAVAICTCSDKKWAAEIAAAFNHMDDVIEDRRRQEQEELSEFLDRYRPGQNINSG